MLLTLSCPEFDSRCSQNFSEKFSLEITGCGRYLLTALLRVGGQRLNNVDLTHLAKSRAFLNLDEDIIIKVTIKH